MFWPADEVTAVFRVLDGIDENESPEHVLYLSLSALIGWKKIRIIYFIMMITIVGKTKKEIKCTIIG